MTMTKKKNKWGLAIFGGKKLAHTHYTRCQYMLLESFCCHIWEGFVILVRMKLLVCVHEAQKLPWISMVLYERALALVPENATYEDESRNKGVRELEENESIDGSGGMKRTSGTTVVGEKGRSGKDAKPFCLGFGLGEEDDELRVLDPPRLVNSHPLRKGPLAASRLWREATSGGALNIDDILGAACLSSSLNFLLFELKF
ncbi:hypothetical protein Sjap_013753 [Stephania japonica]|uniref:Uncharacterized protein n=1 Tax=Stephania japonica TaxID=461633 RepID=A0AAP0P1L3_9MAGN